MAKSKSEKPGPGAPQSVDLLITGCDVVTMDAAASVVRDGAIALKRNKIVWIGTAREAAKRFKPVSRLDGSGQIAMPGMIDGHVHTAQQLLRGKLAEMAHRTQLKIPIWLNYYIPFESMLGPEDVHLSGLVCYSNMIAVGTTCFAEAGGPHPDAMGKAALEIGIRGIVSLSTCDQGRVPKSMMATTRQCLDRNTALVKRWKDQDRVQAWLSLRQIMTCSPTLIEGMADAARSLNTRIHTHLDEGTYEIDYSLEHFGKRPAEYLLDINALNQRLHCAHSVLLSAHEMDLYVKHRPSACHCAFGNYQIGPHRLLEMWRRGIDIGLGTDGAAGYGSMDIFRVAHAARIGQQAVMGTPWHYRGVMSGEELLRVATMGGARSLHMQDQIGSLEAGKKADILLIDRSDMEHTPMYDPLFVLATTTVGRDVRTVIIDGRIVMKDREMLTVDRGEVDRRLAERWPQLMQRFEEAVT